MDKKIKRYTLSAGRMRPVEDGHWSIPEWCNADDVVALEQELLKTQYMVDDLKCCGNCIHEGEDFYCVECKRNDEYGYNVFLDDQWRKRE
jgi:hypothetical protein